MFSYFLSYFVLPNIIFDKLFSEFNYLTAYLYLIFYYQSISSFWFSSFSKLLRSIARKRFNKTKFPIMTQETKYKTTNGYGNKGEKFIASNKYMCQFSFVNITKTVITDYQKESKLALEICYSYLLCLLNYSILPIN